MVVLPEGHSAQPGPGIRQEHVLEVLVCQLKHLRPLAGAGLHPAQEAGTSWHPQSRHWRLWWENYGTAEIGGRLVLVWWPFGCGQPIVMNGHFGLD